MKKNNLCISSFSLFFTLTIILFTPTLSWSKGHSLNHQNPFISALPSGHSLSIYGDFIATGNSIVCQKTGSNSCNNNYTGYLYDTNLIYKNAVSTAIIPLNSSTATLTLPSGITGTDILWAGLYWQGHIAGTNANNYSSDTNIQNRNKINTIWPDGSTSSITADTVWYHDFWGNNTGNAGGYRSFYQGYKNVTTLLKNHLISGITQPITVGNIKANNGSDWYSYFYLGPGAEVDGLKLGFWGNWSLVIVYNYPANAIPANVKFKNIQVAHGFDAMVPLDINGYKTFNIILPLSGFLTPTSGAINSKMLFYASGGEKNIARDAFYIQNANNNYTYTAVSNALNPSNNPFNGTVSDNGVALNSTISYYPGLDLDTYNISQYMKNQQTNTSLKLEATFTNNNSDQSMPGIIAFSTDIYQPFITIQKTTTSSGVLTPNLPISYTANIQNTGNENAENIIVSDNFNDNNLSTIDGTITNPLITLADLLDHNTTKIYNSIACVYGSSNTDCKNNCSVTASPLKVSCTIPRLDINETAIIQFQTTMATNPDTQNQTVNVENKMEATYSNALTHIVITEPATSNTSAAGTYTSAILDGLFNAWETSQSSSNPKLYTKTAGNPISFDVGKIDGAPFTGSVCASIVASSGSLIAAYQCLNYNALTSQTFTWNTINTAYQDVFVNIKISSLQNQTDPTTGIWSDSNSTDHFSIRPDHFTFDTTGLPAKLKAGEEYNFLVNAFPLTGTTPVDGYNQSKANLTLAVDKRRATPNNETIDNTLSGDLNFSPANFSFTDGISPNTGITYSDVGFVSIKLSDTSWTAIDSSDDGANPIANRTIQGEANVTFVPFDFNLSNVSIHNNANSNFTYLSDNTDMSAKVALTITARNKQGGTTQNYSNGLFENNISITPSIAHTAMTTRYGAALNNQDINFTNGV
ncbi:MAG: hypothetical protein PHR87_08980 [Sulfurospirillaceae bacterium]|nr:hypothetical protein [Sulfurospirillaceae bacterium]